LAADNCLPAMVIGQHPASGCLPVRLPTICAAPPSATPPCAAPYPWCSASHVLAALHHVRARASEGKQGVHCMPSRGCTQQLCSACSVRQFWLGSCSSTQESRERTPPHARSLWPCAACARLHAELGAHTQPAHFIVHGHRRVASSLHMVCKSSASPTRHRSPARYWCWCHCGAERSACSLWRGGRLSGQEQRTICVGRTWTAPRTSWACSRAGA